MKRGVIILLFLLMPFVAADTSWIFNAREVQLTNEIHQQVDIIRASQLSRVGYVKINTTLFPKATSRQRIAVQFTDPNSTKQGDFNVFGWRLPTGSLNYSVYTSISNQYIFKEIRKKVQFPINEIPRGFEIYVKETKRVDSSNPEIKAIASKIAEGEDDLYVLLFKLGVWMHDNINYSLEQDVRNSVKSASWVLDNKRGACDEFSALFMAIARALNIPVRYVTGEAYSNMDKENPWQLHGWVEAYFPVYGWIPYDPTFGELGFIDNSHIEFMYSADVGKSPATITYDAVDTNFSISTPLIITEVISTTEKVSRLLPMRIEPYKATVGLKSYNIITIILNNTQEFYQSEFFTLVPVEGLKYLGERSRFVVLRPKEVKKEYFVIETEASLSDRYAYTFPLKTVTPSNYSVSSSFESKRDFEVLSYDRMMTLLEQFQREQTTANKTISNELLLKCDFVGNQSYVEDILPFNCTVKNMGNIILNPIKICDKYACAPFNLGIQETKYFSFTEKYDSPGDYDVIFRVEGHSLSKSDINSIRVAALPSLDITLLQHPESVSYKDNFKIIFLLNNTVNSPVNDVRVNLSHSYLHSSIALPDFQNKKLITIDSRARDLVVGSNNFTLLVAFKDLEGRTYETKKTFNIRLERLSFVQKIPIWFRIFFNWLDNMFIS